MTAMATSGEAPFETLPWSYLAYAALTRIASPLAAALCWRRALTGADVAGRWRERLGVASPKCEKRPHGPLVWLHGASLGECAMLVPIIQRCIHTQHFANFLLTTHNTASLLAMERVLSSQPAVTCQYAPIDTVHAVESFLSFWRPDALVVVESELWPNLLLSRRLHGVPTALVNARMSLRSFEQWRAPALQPLVAAMLAQLALIATPSTEQGVRFQLLGASPSVMRYTADLKLASRSGVQTDDATPMTTEDELKSVVSGRRVWAATSTHAGEEVIMGRVHLALLEEMPTLLTIIAPRNPDRRHDIAKALRGMGLSVALRSSREAVTPSTHVYLMDTLGELDALYATVAVAFVGGSMLPGMTGHNLSEAARASCAILTGPHVDNFRSMLEEMQQSSPLSVLQVSEESELATALAEVLRNEAIRKARRIASKRFACSSGSGSSGSSISATDKVVDSVWNALLPSTLKPALEAAAVAAAAAATSTCNGEGQHNHRLQQQGSNGGGSAVAAELVRKVGPDAELNPILRARLQRAESTGVRLWEPNRSAPSDA